MTGKFLTLFLERLFGRPWRRWRLGAAPALVLALAAAAPIWAQEAGPQLWPLAARQESTHQFATLFAAQDVARSLSSEAGRSAAVAWCKKTGVTKVYIEVFRDGYHAEMSALEAAKRRFRREGFDVSGCVTTTGVGKKSNHYSAVSCYTDAPTQEHLQRIFEDAASVFDEIMIDDFWFTDCTCAECDAARRAQTVTVGHQTFHVADPSWESYRRELMARVSQIRLLEAAKRVNPRVKLIIKYPQWYDRFQERGYDVSRETRLFDRIWVGTETRDYTDRRWGGTPQYEGFFIMRWLGGIGGPKCGGGWFDWLGTTPKTYLEQARQTILGGARESMLFCYGGLQSSTGPEDVQALRAHLPELLALAHQVRRRQIVGLAAYKPPNSHPENEPRVFDFLGMLGFPLVPCHEFPANAPAAFFSLHALKDPNFAAELRAFVASGRPVLLTDGLAARLMDPPRLRSAPNVFLLPVHGDPKSLLSMAPEEIDRLRQPLLKPFETTLQAPARVSLFLFNDGSWALENFNDAAASVKLDGQSIDIPARDWRFRWKPTNPPRI